MQKYLECISANDEIMKALVNKLPSYKKSESNTPLEDLIRSIIGQQLSNRAATTIYNRFIQLVGEPLDIDYLNSVSIDKLKSVGLSTPKSRFIKNVVEKIVSSPNYFLYLETLSNDDVILELTSIKGVGSWTAQMFLMFSLGRMNILPTSDVGIKNAVQKFYNLDSKPNLEQLELIGANWEPYRTVGCWYLWKALDNKIEI